MEQLKMKTWFFIPDAVFKANNYLSNLLLCIILLFLSGCITKQNTASLAPAPPLMNDKSFVKKLNNLPSNIEINTLSVQPENIVSNADITIRNSLKTGSVTKDNCRFKDRFDRKAIIAYEWGRSRVALDVDGVNLSGSSARGVFVAYKLRLQPEKTKAQRCRYDANWQGLIGSGYNEFIVRKENTIWNEIKEVKSEVFSHVGSMF